MRNTQHQKIINMCLDKAWHCQNEFRALFIYSPHKRRGEIQAKGEYYFKDRPCEHGVRGQKDYIMLSRGGVEVARESHKLIYAGANPAPATKPVQIRITCTPSKPCFSFQRFNVCPHIKEKSKQPERTLW